MRPCWFKPSSTRSDNATAWPVESVFVNVEIEFMPCRRSSSMILCTPYVRPDFTRNSSFNIDVKRPPKIVFTRETGTRSGLFASIPGCTM